MENNILKEITVSYKDAAYLAGFTGVMLTIFYWVKYILRTLRYRMKVAEKDIVTIKSKIDPTDQKNKLATTADVEKSLVTVREIAEIKIKSIKEDVGTIKSDVSELKDIVTQQMQNREERHAIINTLVESGKTIITTTDELKGMIKEVKILKLNHVRKK